MKTYNPTSSSVAVLASLAATFAISSCTLPPSVAWHQIKQDGLITFLSTPYQTSAPVVPVIQDTPPAEVTVTPTNTAITSKSEQYVGPPKPSTSVTTTQAPVTTSSSIVTPVPVKTAVNIMPAQDKAQMAISVPSLPGFVRSPYTTPPRLVDVKGVATGASMVCPYTQRVFIVPSDFISQPEATFVASTATATVKVMAQPPEIAVKNNTPSTTPTVTKTNPPVIAVKNNTPSTTPPVTKTIPPVIAVKNSTPSAPQEATTPPANALFKSQPTNNTPPATNITVAVKPATPELPYGMPIPNRPGFVNSPFAARHQLVDVTGLPIGMEVKCPYTGKLFKVPASDIAEQKTLASPGAPPAPEKAEKK